MPISKFYKYAKLNIYKPNHIRAKNGDVNILEMWHFSLKFIVLKISSFNLWK